MKSETTTIDDSPAINSPQMNSPQSSDRAPQSDRVPRLETESRSLESNNRRVDFPDGDLARRLQCHLNSFVGKEQVKTPSGSPLDITVLDGRVVISGEVESVRDRDFILNCCRRVAGVIQLDDRDLKATH